MLFEDFIKFFKVVPLKEYEKVKDLLSFKDGNKEIALMVSYLLVENNTNNVLNDYEINRILTSYKEYINTSMNTPSDFAQNNLLFKFEDSLKNHFYPKVFNKSYDEIFLEIKEFLWKIQF